MTDPTFDAYIDRLNATLAEAEAAAALEERRRHPRYELVLAVTMHGDNNLYTSIAADISEGGMFIATSQRLPIGTPVLMSFTLPTSPWAIVVRGTVRWVRDPEALASGANNYNGDTASTVKPGMGVQFDELDADTLKALRRFLHYRTPELFE